MNSDASLPPNAPMTNGIVSSAARGEADASTPPSPSQSLREVCADLHSRVSAFLSAAPSDQRTKSTQEQTRVALGVIERALQDYEFDALSLSYNGGKDCLVLLILYLAVLHTHFTQPDNSRRNPPSSSTQNQTTDNPDFFPTTIPSIYAKPPDPFPAVTTFVNSSSHRYHLSLVHISTNPGPRRLSSAALAASNNPPKQAQNSSEQPPVQQQQQPQVSFRDAFALYLSSHPSVRAIFVGTRRTDPHGSHLTHFDPTDHNWPPFMRIHPVIDWRLSEIWTFLRSPHLCEPDGSPLEYCAMYDMGYTSLGGVNDTLKNPRLKYTDSEGSERHRPAYEMFEDLEERLGRE